MSVIDSTSQATAVGVGAKNLPFSFAGENVQSIIGIAGTYDPAITTITDEEPLEVISADDVGAKTGFGFPLHRAAIKIFQGTEGAGTVYIIPQSETGTASAGEIAWSGTITKAGTIYLRIANELYTVDIANAATIENVSDAVVAAVNEVAAAPVVAAKTAVTFETTFTAKHKGLTGDDITITLYAAEGETGLAPTGLVGAITAMTGGAGTPDIQDALDGLGTGDEANQLGLTEFFHTYGVDTSTIDKISLYVGEGNNFTGLYSKLIGRPFFSLNCDTTPGSAGYTALKAITDARLNDRANGILGAPDEDDMPSDIAALASGIIGRLGQQNPAQNYAGQALSGVGRRSVSANRWTKDYSSGRDAAVKAGISPTKVISEQLFLQNVVTFYRPASVATGSNGYKSVRSFWITRNVLHNIRLFFESEDWQGITIVNDKSLVTDFEAKQKARDLVDVRTAFNNLTDFFVRKSWFFDDVFPKENSEYTIRALSNGFDVIYRWKMSGEVHVINVQSTFDTNIAS